MNVKLVLSIVLLFVAVLFLLSISPVSACDPSKGDYTDCPVTPTGTIFATSTPAVSISITPTITNAVTLTPTLTVAAAITQTLVPTITAILTPTLTVTATATLTPTPTSIAIRGEGLLLACLMPDADSPSNALGIVV